MGCKEKDVPCGIVEEESGELRLTFGSSANTSDCIVDTLAATWEAMEESEKAATRRLQIPSDHGPESRGRRTPCLHRMGQLADAINKPMPRRYSPPSHSQYHPIERCWGLVELPWNGTQLIDAATMREWAKKRTWKGRHPVSELSRKVSHKGIALGKTAMQAVAARLKRDPQWPKYDIVINPVSTS
jgi:hypothetical protein